MDKAFLFAQSLERNILVEVERMSERALPAVAPAFELIVKLQHAWVDIFSNIENKEGEYPVLNTVILVGSDKEWQKIMALLGEVECRNTDCLVLISMVYAIIDKALQYYQQAASNTAFPSEQLFFTSLAKYKLLMKKRIDGIVRIIYNHAWSEVGFAPFVLGKN